MNTKLLPLRDVLRRQLAAIKLRDWLPSRGNLLFTLLVALCLVAATTSGVLAAPQRMAAQSGTSTGAIAYQGRLADASGAPLTGTYILTFRLYNAASGGSPLWEEIWIGANNVQVTNGLFSVMLGSITPLPQSLFTCNSSLWLGIDVGSDPEMTPRVQLGSAPFAFQAQHAERANGLSAPDGDPADAVVVDNNGNVGIGTTNPATALQVEKTTTNDVVRIYRVGNSTAPALVISGAPTTDNITDKIGISLGYETADRSGGCAAASILAGKEGDFTNITTMDGYLAFAIAADCTNYERLRITSVGNVGIGTTNPTHPLEMFSGAYVTTGGVWTNSSDRNLKENFTAIDGKSLLEKVASLPISEWNYKAENSSVKHIGPMAQDFYAAFNLGEDDKHISTVDASGVALAAIQSLTQRVKQQDSQIAALNARVAALERSGGQPAGLFSAWDILVILAMAGGLIVCWRHAQKKGVQS